MVFILRIALLIALFAPAMAVLLLVSCSAKANDQLMLHGNFALSTSRPISILVVPNAQELCAQDGVDSEIYGCAKNAFGKGRCVIYIRPDKLEYLYHEMQHCARLEH